MTDDFNDVHQLKISKLQERLNNISSGLRKNLTTEIQKEKQQDTSNLYSSITLPLTQRQQKQSYDEIEKKLIEKVSQKVTQEPEHKILETASIKETQQKSSDDFSSKKLEIQDLDQINIKQNVMPDSKSWQPWTHIPREKLRDLEKKTLSRFLKKH